MIAVIISAGPEWDEVKKRYRDITLFSSPFGKWFETIVESFRSYYFFIGGWGKISAASSAAVCD